MPHLQDLWSEVSQSRKDVLFVCVNNGDPKSVIQKWWDDASFTMRAVRQKEGAASKAFGVQAYPTNYVVGPDGKVLYRAVGFEPDAIRAALASTIEK